MKTNQLKSIATVALIMATTFFVKAQNSPNNSYDPNYDNRNYSDNRSDDDRYYNYNDNRTDDDRIRDYERNRRNDFRRNPYDSRNLPNNWQRYSNNRFDWFRFDIYNQYDPRFGSRYGYDLYYPWDPNNPYDIRNQRDYYGSARYWSGHRPTRIIIVPPAIRFGIGRSYGYSNRNYGNNNNRGFNGGNNRGQSRGQDNSKGRR